MRDFKIVYTDQNQGVLTHPMPAHPSPTYTTLPPARPSPLSNLPASRPLHTHDLVAVEQAERVERSLDLDSGWRGQQLDDQMAGFSSDLPSAWYQPLSRQARGGGNRA